MDFNHLAQIANSNARFNFGKKFTAESIRQFLDDCETYAVFRAGGVDYGLLTVTPERELGFILHRSYVRTGMRHMVRVLNELADELWCEVQPDNHAIIKLLQRNSFVIDRFEQGKVILRRAAWE